MPYFMPCRCFSPTAIRNRRDYSRFVKDTKAYLRGRLSSQYKTRIASSVSPPPSARFCYPKRPILRTEVAIHQFGDFLSGARPLDPVQPSPDLFVEPGIRVRTLPHMLLWHRKAALMKKLIRLLFALRRTPNYRGLKRKFLGPTGESICGLPLVHALRQRPAYVYVRSNPFGPSTRISQFSLASDPAMVTRQSPRLSLNACSMLAMISFDTRASPRFCNSAGTPIAI